MLCVPLFVFAQSEGTIRGRIIDADSKDNLAGANVVILGDIRGASTDINGNFFIDRLPVGSYRIEASYVGYISEIITDVEVRSAKPAVLNIELKPQKFESEAIVVSAGYFAEEKLTQPSVIRFSKEEIRRFPGGFEDVVRTVSVLPGVSVNTSGGRNDLLVRGGGPSENLYVINNIEVPNINHFGTQGSSSGSLSFINLDFVDNVRFSSGGFQARYGEKMSSILTLDMAQGRSDQLGGKALISATQFGLNVDGPLNKGGNFIFSARKSYLDLIFKAAGLPFIPEYTDFNFLGNYELAPGNTLNIIGLAAIDRVARNLDTEENRTTNARLLDNSQDQFIGGLNYRRIHKNGYADLTLSAAMYRFQFSQADNNQEEYFNSEASEIEYAVKGLRFRKMASWLNLVFGFNAKLFNNNNTTVFADSIFDRNGLKIPVFQIGADPVNKTDQWIQTYAAFIETDMDISSRLNLNLGLRLNYYNALNDPFYAAPRLGLKYQINSKHSLKLNYGHYFQPPSSVWLVNKQNRDLKALQNRMAIFGWDYLVREDLRFTAEVYYKKYSDLPTGNIPGISDYVVMSNTGSSYGGREDNFQSFGYFDLFSNADGRAYGIELLLQKKFSDIPLYGKTSLTFGKSELTAGSGRVYPAQFDQRFIFNLSAGYKLGSKWEFSGKFRYFTGIPYTPVYRPSQNPSNPGFVQNLPSEYLSERLDAGHHLDLRVDRYFNFSNWTLITFIDIQNVYNYKVPIVPQYDFWEDEIQTSNSIGLLPSIGISAEF